MFQRISKKKYNVTKQSWDDNIIWYNFFFFFRLNMSYF
jgi:hypothetical protein